MARQSGERDERPDVGGEAFAGWGEDVFFRDGARVGVTRLPVVASYTVDVRLREFRRVTRDGMEIIPFESEEGKVLLFLLWVVGRR